MLGTTFVTADVGKLYLILANAVGPETHTYASMAVHLYMRKPAG